MRRFLYIILALAAVLWGTAPVSAAAEADRDYLARAIAVSYPEISFGARVAIAAVVLNRTGASGYPDSCAGAVLSLAAEGEFGGIDSIAAEIDEKLYRISRDAVAAAENGADPSHGALHFRLIRRSGKADLNFDDALEDEAARSIRRELKSLTHGEVTVIDGVGFY